MATTSIWKIKKRLDTVIHYTTDEIKTNKSNYNNLHNVIEYTKCSYKTEEQLYVSTLNCSKENAYKDMIRTKRRYGKEDGILGYHAFQSFVEGEVTPELAHEIGVKLAEELWGDNFEVVVSTHINTKHIHNHFCLNSVSFKTGKKYYDNRASYALMREISDRLCEEYQLSVIENKNNKKSMSYDNYYKSGVNNSKVYNDVKQDIDYAIQKSSSYNEFLNIIKGMDYEIINRYGKLSIRLKNKKRNIRIERAFGEEYSIQNIINRIFDKESMTIPLIEVRTLKGKYKYNSKNKTKLRSKKKIKGIRALYFHYCYLLKVFPSKKKVFSKSLREDVKKMDKISKEARFLSKTEIQNTKELYSYKSKIISELKELKSEREYLWKKYRRVKTEEEQINIKNEIKKVSSQIGKLNYTKSMVDDIEERTPIIQKNIKEEQENNRLKSRKLEVSERGK